MSPTRREVLLGLGGTTLAYALQVGCAPASRSDETLGAVELEGTHRKIRLNHLRLLDPFLDFHQDLHQK